jgi:hypothetical protein
MIFTVLVGSNCVHSALRPPMAYCASPGWLWWWWRNWWNDWQEKTKYSENTCPSASLSTTNPTCSPRTRTRAAAVGSQRITAWATARLYNFGKLFRNHQARWWVWKFRHYVTVVRVSNQSTHMQWQYFRAWVSAFSTVATSLQKAKCALRFDNTKCVKRVKRRSRTEFGVNPLSTPPICAFYKYLWAVVYVKGKFRLLKKVWMELEH